MSKKTILLKNSSPAIPVVKFWRPYFEKHFNVEQMGVDCAFSDYDPATHIFWASSPENIIDWAEQVLDAGFPLIMDYLWDHFGYSHRSDNILMLRSNNFIFPNEALMYIACGYKDIVFNSDPDKFFLCLMNQNRDHRNTIYENIKQYHDVAYISYLDKGIQIPGDTVVMHDDKTWSGSPGWQRYVNADWYNRTNFSLVVETGIGDPRFYSEKILKPLAFKHVFIAWAPYNILDRLKMLGFESFENIIDESYNLEVDNTKRLNMIMREVDRLHSEFIKNNKLFTDNVTMEKLEHNYNLFYNQQLIDKIIQQEIIDPVVEFAYG